MHLDIPKEKDWYLEHVYMYDVRPMPVDLAMYLEDVRAYITAPEFSNAKWAALKTMNDSSEPNQMIKYETLAMVMAGPGSKDVPELAKWLSNLDNPMLLPEFDNEINIKASESYDFTWNYIRCYNIYLTYITWSQGGDILAKAEVQFSFNDVIKGYKELM